MLKELQNEKEIQNDLKQIFPESSNIPYIQEHAQEYAELMAYYRCAMMEVETKFNVLNEDFSLQFDRNPIESIKSRLKRPASIRNKLERYGLEFSMDSIRNNWREKSSFRTLNLVSTSIMAQR